MYVEGMQVAQYMCMLRERSLIRQSTRAERVIRLTYQFELRVAVWRELAGKLAVCAGTDNLSGFVGSELCVVN